MGVPDPTLGEEVAAAVVLKAGAEANEAQLIDFVRGQVAAYKYPRRLWFTKELPKGPSGKILKRNVVVPAVQGARPYRAGSRRRAGCCDR